MKLFLVSIVCITLVIMLLGLIGAPDEAVAQKDTLVVGIPDDPQSLDPAFCYDIVCSKILFNVYENLVTFPEGDQSRIVPQLAESWELAEDGRTWIFHLRKGVTFASGNPVNADAVVFSLRRLVKLAEGPSWLLTQFGVTKDSITKIDEYTVQIVLDQQYAPTLFLSCLIFPSTILDPEIVLAHEQDGDLGRAWLEHHSAGSGPYTIQEHQQQKFVVLTANDLYWGTQPAFKQLIVKNIGEPSEQVALLQAGELDIAQNMTIDDIRMLGNDPAVQIFQNLRSNIVHLAMNLKYKPFASPEVRDAIRYAMDYDGIIAYVLGGAAEKHQSFIPKGFLGYTSAIPYIQDVDRARQLLVEGGYPEGFELELKCPDHSPWLELAMKLKEDLAGIGVILHIMPLNEDRLAEATYEHRDFQMFLWQWWYDYADTDSNAKAFAYCDSAGNDATIKGNPAWVTSYVNPETSALVEQAAQEANPEKRRVLYERISKIVSDDGPYVFLYAPFIHYAVRTEIIQSFGAPEYSNEFMILQ